jgi:hypothetical protein
VLIKNDPQRKGELLLVDQKKTNREPKVLVGHHGFMPGLTRNADFFVFYQKFLRNNSGGDHRVVRYPLEKFYWKDIYTDILRS